MNFDALFVNPNGCTPRNQFVPALVTVLAALAFFTYIVPGRTSQFCQWVLMYPLMVLLARRLLDMGKSRWLVLVPLALTFTTFASKLGYLPLADPLKSIVDWIALVVTALVALWGCVGHDLRRG